MGLSPGSLSTAKGSGNSFNFRFDIFLQRLGRFDGGTVIVVSEVNRREQTRGAEPIPKIDIMIS